MANTSVRERALVQTLPALAEPDVATDDSRFALDGNQLELGHSTEDVKWKASVEYADTFSVAGNYGFFLSRKHARGIGFSLGPDRKEVLLCEAFNFGRKTQLRFSLGGTVGAEQVRADGSMDAPWTRTRSVEVRRWSVFDRNVLELGVAAYQVDDKLVKAEQSDPDRLRGVSANLSLAPHASALRLDIGIERRTHYGANAGHHADTTHVYRLHAEGRLRECRSLDFAYDRNGGDSTFSLHLDGRMWRVGLSAARATAERRTDIALQVAVELPIERTAHDAGGCGDSAPARPERRDLINEVTSLPDLYVAS